MEQVRVYKRGLGWYVGLGSISFMLDSWRDAMEFVRALYLGDFSRYTVLEGEHAMLTAMSMNVRRR